MFIKTGLLIEPHWNVNRVEEYGLEVVEILLIEPHWNVNEDKWNWWRFLNIF